MVVGFMGSVFLYCAAVYAGAYYLGIYPLLMMLGKAWDVAALSVAILTIAPIGRAARKQARMPLLAAFAVMAAARWWNPSLYPYRF